MSERRENLFQICAKILDIPAELVTENLVPSDVESWDSMKHLMLIMAVEEEFGLSLTDRQMVSIGGVKDLIGLIKQDGND